jgi:hypothetical protein
MGLRPTVALVTTRWSGVSDRYGVGSRPRWAGGWCPRRGDRRRSPLRAAQLCRPIGATRRKLRSPGGSTGGRLLREVGSLESFCGSRRAARVTSTTERCAKAPPLRVRRLWRSARGAAAWSRTRALLPSRPPHTLGCFTGPANSADDEIVRLVTTQAHPEEILVATSDRILSDRVRAARAALSCGARQRNLINPS